MSALYSLPCSMQVIRSRVPRLSTVPTGSVLSRRVQITVRRSCASIKRTSNSMSTSKSAVADARTLARVVVRTMSHGSEAPPVDWRPDPDLGGVGFPGPLPAMSHLLRNRVASFQPIAVHITEPKGLFTALEPKFHWALAQQMLMTKPLRAKAFEALGSSLLGPCRNSRVGRISRSRRGKPPRLSPTERHCP
jgi:hypothetical protein